MKSLLTVFSLCLCFALFAQDEGLKYYDHIYLDNIKSVRFHLEDLLLSQPLYEINSGGRLRFSFDDIDGDVKDYVYTVVHCDRNWNPSDLTEMEYIDGFPEEMLDNYSFSFKTIGAFTHFELMIPNRDMTLTKSGNYLLKVYEDEGEKRLAITRRFMVVDSKVDIQARMVRPSQVSLSNTHQEIDFMVNYQRFPMRSPQQEVRATILQNGRWDNAVVNLPPMFNRLDELSFDHQNKVVFPAGKEFRYLDLRSVYYPSENIYSIQAEEDIYEVALYKDQKRFNMAYLNREDINGKFVIETLDQNNMDLSSNYANVLFALYSPEPYFDYDVYLFGGLTDWRIQNRFKMVYNNQLNGYVGKVMLKQGYYDYAYAVVPTDGSDRSANMSEVEGDWFETENEYTILIYYSPFGGRYDQLIGSVTISSSKN